VGREGEGMWGREGEKRMKKEEDEKSVRQPG